MEERQDSPRRFFWSGWLLAGGLAVLLVALWLWSERLSPQQQPAKKEAPADQPRPDGGPQPGENRPLPFAGESCRPWNISAAIEPPQKLAYLFITSRLVDPDGLMLSGFASECGSPAALLRYEALQQGELTRAARQANAQVVVAIGLAATKQAESELPHLPLLYAAVANPGASALDRPGAAGVSPWLPAGPIMRHWLSVLPGNAGLALFHPRQELEEMAREMEQLAREAGRSVELFPFGEGEDIEPLLERAARHQAWAVLCDRARDQAEIFERILARAEKNKLPVVVSDEDHVRLGALAGAGADSHRIGRQLCRLASAALTNRLPAGSRIFCPEYSFAVVHLTRAEKLGYLLDPAKTPQIKVYRWH